MMNQFIVIDDFCKTFGKGTVKENKVLSHISFGLDKADFGVIVGGNGAGKSTLLNSLAGELKLDSGKLIIDKQDITQTDTTKRSVFISRVFQDPTLGTAPRMTIAQNLALANKRGQKRGFKPSVKKDDLPLFKKRLKQLDLGLEDRLDADMGSLSGGQRQAVSLVMATLTKPDLLLLDEHTAALDPHTQRLVMQLTDQLVREYGITTLMITHSLSDAVAYGDKLFILNHGELVKTVDRESKKSLTIDNLFHSMGTL